MKSRFHKLILSLLIAVMCANCALPAIAAGEMTESEKKYFEDGIAASKKWFLQLYGQLWKEGGLEAKLAEAVNKGVDEKMNSMLPGTRSARMMLEENQKDALGLVIKEFAPVYEGFLQSLQKRFTDENNRELEIFYENLTDEAVAKINDSNVKIKNIEIGAYNPEQVAKSLRKNHKGTNIKSDTVEIEITSPDFSRQVNSGNEKIGADKAGVVAELKEEVKALVSDFSVAGMVPSFAGIFMSVFRKLSSLGSIWNASDKLKAEMKSVLSVSFALQSAYYWEAMEGDVRAIFEETYAVFQLDKERLNEEIRSLAKEADDFANDPEMEALLEERRATEGQ